MRGRLLVPCALLAIVAVAVAGQAAQAGPEAAKKPRLSIPLPKSGDFTVGLVTVKAKAKPGKKVPKNLKVKLKLASKALAPQVTVAGSVRKNNRTTFDVVVAVVNKRTGKQASRASTAASVQTPQINIDVLFTPVSANVTLELVEMLPGPRPYLDNILTRPASQQASWDPVWKGAMADVVRGVDVYLDKGLAEEGLPEEYLELIIGIALEISEDGEPDKGQALDILGEVNELYVQVGDFACEVTVQRNRFFPDIVDIFVRKCQEPIVEFALVFPEMEPGLAYAPVIMFTPQGQVAGNLTAGCKQLDNAVYGIECPVTGFKATYDIAAGFRGAPAGTPFSVAMCQSSDDIAVFSQRVPA
ncbi:MAG TPA: hypothetical protein VFR32_07190 [Gaiellaceae bacterium]|nr:hypothetical protein [Gaiellaceae bacterium]